MYGPTSLQNIRPKSAGERGIIDAAPASLGRRNPGDEIRPSPAGNCGIIDAVPASLGGRNPKEKPADTRNIIDAAPDYLGGQNPRKKRPRGYQLQGQRQRPTSKGVVVKTTRITETAKITDTEDHGHSKDHGHNKYETRLLKILNTKKQQQKRVRPTSKGKANEAGFSSGISFLCFHQNTPPPF